MANDSDIPPTEPTVTATQEPPKKPKPRNAPAAAAKPRTRIAGSELLPDLERDRVSVETSFWYWIGVLPSCPVEHVTLAGECFPKVEEEVYQIDGRTQRTPVIGALVRLDERKILAMRDRLQRTIVRMIGEQKEEPGTGKNIRDAHVRPGRGHLITIPKPEEVAKRAEQGLPSRRYVQAPGDLPAARFLFAQLCENQERPQRGTYYPETLEVTGLEWPGELS